MALDTNQCNCCLIYVLYLLQFVKLLLPNSDVMIKCPGGAASRAEIAAHLLREEAAAAAAEEEEEGYDDGGGGGNDEVGDEKATRPTSHITNGRLWLRRIAFECIRSSVCVCVRKSESSASRRQQQ